MEKKNQHVIPECYLKAWCDPQTPAGYTPYVWVHNRDGSASKKKPPRKLFTETEFYTVKLQDGSRQLLIEDNFSVIEDRFARLRAKIEPYARFSDEDRGLLALFTAMMVTRTKSQRAVLTDFYSRLHEQVESMEKAHNAKPDTSRDTAQLKEYGHHMFMGHSINVIVDWLFQMNMVIFATGGTEKFITSDRPCVWFNPQAYKFPPLLRSPGLAQGEVEVTLPLSPEFFVVFSWRKWDEKLSIPAEQIATLGDVVLIPDEGVTEMNRRTRGYCDDFFVTQTAEVNSTWLDLGEEPKDSWDKVHGSKSSVAETR